MSTIEGPGLRQELTRSIQHTIDKESVRNESTIASARAATVFGALLVEVWLLYEGSKLGVTAYPLAAVTLIMLGWSLVLWRVLARGGWHPSLPFVVPTLDALYFGIRQGGALQVLGREHFVDVQDLATVVAMCAVIIVTGAYRLTTRALVFAAGLAFALYLVFVVWIQLPVFFASVHLLLLFAVAMAAMGLTRIVDRAVHSEVTRLTLGRLLPALVLDAAHDDPIALLSEPRSMDVTVLITDLRGFTAWSEEHTPLEVLAHLNRVQGALADVVYAHQGTVDKFMGDGMLAVFGAPSPLADHADRALRAARAMQDALEQAGLHDIRIGIGIHSGEVVVGCLGSGMRMEFTVLGDTVNTASRLESMTKEKGVPILISGTTAKRSSVPTRSVGTVMLRGRQEPVEVYTLEAS